MGTKCYSEAVSDPIIVLMFPSLAISCKIMVITDSVMVSCRPFTSASWPVGRGGEEEEEKEEEEEVVKGR